MSPIQKQKSAGEVGAEPAALSQLVDYQPGAVVSREVIARPGGSVTLFAFDEGQGLSEHTAPFDALVSVLDGEAQVTISDRTVAVAAGQMIVMPANRPHALKARRRFKMLLVMIRS
jgi:quercetin dioxygenase-like cupin family protein